MRHSRFVRKLRGTKKRSSMLMDDMGMGGQETSSTLTCDSGSKGTTVSLFSMPSMQMPPGMMPSASGAPAKRGQEEESRECEAALNLLSMAAGKDGAIHGLTMMGGMLGTMGSVGVVPSDIELDIISVVKGDTLAKLLPLLNPQQLGHLKSLCELFDNSYKELVAAHAARDAVARILASKQEEANNANGRAARATGELHAEAVKLAEWKAARAAEQPAAKQQRTE